MKSYEFCGPSVFINFQALHKGGILWRISKKDSALTKNSTVGGKVVQIFLLLKLLVDGQVKFGQVITSITERLSTQYAADHNSQPADNKYGWIFGIRYVPPGMDGSNRDFHEQIWIHPEMTHGEFKSKYKVVRQGVNQSFFGEKFCEIQIRAICCLKINFGPKINEKFTPSKGVQMKVRPRVDSSFEFDTFRPD